MMREQMERSVFVPPLHGISDRGLEYVDKIGQITPGNLDFIVEALRPTKLRSSFPASIKNKAGTLTNTSS